jgi:hypothetical protein
VLWDRRGARVVPWGFSRNRASRPARSPRCSSGEVELHCRATGAAACVGRRLVWRLEPIRSTARYAAAVGCKRVFSPRAQWRSALDHPPLRCHPGGSARATVPFKLPLTSPRKLGNGHARGTAAATCHAGGLFVFLASGRHQHGPCRRASTIRTVFDSPLGGTNVV